MIQDEDEIRMVFDFVARNEWSSARQIGLVINGGRSRANQILYKYKEVLFVKRGLTPPQWKVVELGALEQMLGGNTGSLVTTPTPKKKRIPMDWVRRSVTPRPSGSLPKISTCGSCGRPIQPSGMCGCS
jgi:hypothetical protein